MPGVHTHPEYPDYLLIDEAVRGLDGALGADLLPMDRVVRDVDIPSTVFMAKLRAARVRYRVGAGDAGLEAAWMDRFMAALAARADWEHAALMARTPPSARQHYQAVPNRRLPAESYPR